MGSTVRDLAELVGGVLEGDGSIEILSARPVGEAGPQDITFIESERYLPELSASPAAAAVVPLTASATGRALIRTPDPRAAFAAIVERFRRRTPASVLGIDPRAAIHPSATIGADPSIGPFAVIGPGAVVGERCRIGSGASIGANCRLGDDVTIHPNAVLYDGVILGDRVTVHANAVLGADGFGYRFENGRHVQAPQLGHVEIGDDVDIGAATTIDRAAFSATRIGAGTKIDNLVMIGHNCQIGRHNVIVSQVGLAGSSSTGDYVMIAGQVGVVDHVHIGDRSVIGGQAAVTKDVPAGSRMLGSPATPEQDQKRMLMALAGLPELRKTMRWLLQQLGLREQALAECRSDKSAA